MPEETEAFSAITSVPTRRIMQHHAKTACAALYGCGSCGQQFTSKVRRDNHDAALGVHSARDASDGFTRMSFNVRTRLGTHAERNRARASACPLRGNAPPANGGSRTAARMSNTSDCKSAQTQRGAYGCVVCNTPCRLRHDPTGVTAAEYAIYLIATGNVNVLADRRAEYQAAERRDSLRNRAARADTALVHGWALGKHGQDTIKPEVRKALVDMYSEGVRSGRRKWSAEEALEWIQNVRNADGKLRFRYAQYPTLSAIKVMFSSQSTARRAASESVREKRAWTEEENRTIVDHLKDGRPLSQLQLEGRTKAAITAHASQLKKQERARHGDNAVALPEWAQTRGGGGGVQSGPKRRWTAEEEQAIRAHLQRGASTADVRVAGRTAASVQLRVVKMKEAERQRCEVEHEEVPVWAKRGHGSGAGGKKKRWTQDEREQVLNQLRAGVLAQHVSVPSRPPAAVLQMANKLRAQARQRSQANGDSIPEWARRRKRKR